MQLIKPILLDTAIKTLIDELPDGTIYVGKADIGASESDPIWLLFRISITGTVTKVEYADGIARFNYSWSDRSSYPYS